MTKKINLFQRMGKGVRTTFGIKELTPQQKSQKIAKERELEAYKQSISERQKQEWQVAYQKELAKQRLLYGLQKEREARARGMAKAQEEVKVMGQPKQRMAWLTKPAEAIARAMPTPSAKVQTQLDLSLKNLAGDTAMYSKKQIARAKTLKPYEIPNITNIIGDNPRLPKGRTMSIKQMSSKELLGAGAWDINWKLPKKTKSRQLKRGRARRNTDFLWG